MALVKRIIEISVRLAPNTGTNQPVSFSGSGRDTVTLAGSRTSVRIENSGAPAGSKAHITIYGMTLDLMNELATLGMVFQIVPRNTIIVRAGDEQAGLTSVFFGTIQQAYADFNAAPEVPFHFECITGLADSVIPTTASSFPGATDVGTIMAGFAQKMSLGFENSGVSVQLQSPYFSGSIMSQLEKCASDAGIKFYIDPGRLLAIWPKGKSRGGAVPLISKATGMAGYPSYTQQGILVKTLFNPQVGFGGQIKVESALTPANGIWNVIKLDHALDSQVPRGQWQSTISAFNPKYPQPIQVRP